MRWATGLWERPRADRVRLTRQKDMEQATSQFRPLAKQSSKGEPRLPLPAWETPQLRRKPSTICVPKWPSYTFASWTSHLSTDNVKIGYIGAADCPGEGRLPDWAAWPQRFQAAAGIDTTGRSPNNTWPISAGGLGVVPAVRWMIRRGRWAGRRPVTGAAAVGFPLGPQIESP